MQGIRPKEWFNYGVFNDVNDMNYKDYEFYQKSFELQAYVDMRHTEKVSETFTWLMSRIKHASIEVHDTILVTGAMYFTFCDFQSEYADKCLALTRNKFRPNKLLQALIDVIKIKIENPTSELGKKSDDLFNVLNESPLKGTRQFYVDLVV